MQIVVTDIKDRREVASAYDILSDSSNRPAIRISAVAGVLAQDSIDFSKFTPGSMSDLPWKELLLTRSLYLNSRVNKTDTVQLASLTLELAAISACKSQVSLNWKAHFDTLFQP
jgi:hypothetical protein